MKNRRLYYEQYIAKITLTESIINQWFQTTILSLMMIFPVIYTYVFSHHSLTKPEAFHFPGENLWLRWFL